MKAVILLTVLIYSICLTGNYYEKCSSNISFNPTSANQCKEYSANGAYCCYLHYENPKVRQDIIMPTYYNKKDKLCSLGEPKGYCYGISKEGYDKIKDVIKELKKETGIDELYIDCRAKRLKYYLLNILIIILAVL